MILLYGLALFTIYIGPFSIADYSMFFLLIISLWKNKKLKIKRDSADVAYVIFLFAVLIPGIINSYKDYFSLNEFVLSYFKLLFYSVALYLIPRYLYKSKKLNDILCSIVKFVFLLGILQFIVYYSPLQSESFYDYSSISYGFFRITSIYNEPSIIFHPVIIYYYLIFDNYRMSKVTHGLVLIGTIMSFSMTVYAVYLAGFVLLNRKKSIPKLSAAYIFVGIFLIIASINVPLIQVHVKNLIALKPSSSTTRLIGGFEYAFQAPFWGVGLGNIQNYYRHYASSFNLSYLTERGTVNNIFAVIKVFGGFIGLISFTVFIVKKYYSRIDNMFKLVIVSFFAWGNFNSAGFFFLLLLLEVDLYKKQLIKNFGKDDTDTHIKINSI